MFAYIAGHGGSPESLCCVDTNEKVGVVRKIVCDKAHTCTNFGVIPLRLLPPEGWEFQTVTQRKKTAAKGRMLPLKVWDLPTRVFHWTLVLLVAGAWLTVETGRMEWHAWIGQAILTLVVYRIIWGIVGSETVQFWNFIRGPKAIFAYAKGLIIGQHREPVGHNPLGACMIVALLLLLAVQASLGLTANDDIFFEGPLFNLVGKDWSDRLTGIHQLLFNIILAAVIIHVVAVVLYLAVKRENLIGAMITGVKWWPEPLPQIRMTPVWLALPAVAAAAAVVWAAVTYL